LNAITAELNNLPSKSEKMHIRLYIDGVWFSIKTICR